MLPAGYINSAWTLKSPNVLSLMRSAQGGVFVSTPFWTVQQVPFSVLRCFQPSSPVAESSWTGAPQLTVLIGVDTGARFAVQVMGLPTSSHVVPCSVSPTTLPVNRRSLLAASYCTGMKTVSSSLA